MKTNIKTTTGSATHIPHIPDRSVDLVVTSPPYPMIEMWDEIFSQQDQRIGRHLANGRGGRAFILMHKLLDEAWSEVHRVLKPGGIACINIGDATRSLNGEFQLFSNHSRIISSLRKLGFTILPDILWRKPTNSPNKFMGSGMLPAGAYVTYEHEYILIAQKGQRREFRSAEEKANRRESAYFWEERNAWFSDVWFDIKGAPQDIADKAARKRSAAFPFELAYRLICMFSVKGDLVLDPFVGIGTTLAAALTAARNAVGVDIDKSLINETRSNLISFPTSANTYVSNRLSRHGDFVERRIAEGKTLKHRNEHYGFPVVTSQETDLLLNFVLDTSKTRRNTISVSYSDEPHADFSKTCVGARPGKSSSDSNVNHSLF